jgi:MFS family permease
MHKNIRLLRWFNIFTDFKLYAPVAIIYFSEVAGSYALGMSIFSVAMISSALLEIPTGLFSDLIGRRKTVIFGALAAILYAILYAVGRSYEFLFLGAIFEGLARSFYSGNNDALLYDTLSQTGEEHQFDELLGKLGSIYQVAMATSAIVGGILATWSFSLIMWLSVIPQVLCFVIALNLVEPKIHTAQSGNIYTHLKEAYRNFLSNKKLRLLSIASILSYSLGGSGYQFEAAFFGTLWPVWAIGIAKTFSAISASASFWISGRVIKRFGGLRMMLVDSLYNRLAKSIATAFPTVLSPLLMASTSLFFGPATVAHTTLMQKEFTHQQRATMGSLNAFAGNICLGLVSFLLGFAADKLSPAQAILLLQGFQLGNSFLYWRLFRHHDDIPPSLQREGQG